MPGVAPALAWAPTSPPAPTLRLVEAAVTLPGWPDLAVVEADEDDDRTLADRATRGEIEAFAQLYRRYVDRIHGFVYRRSGSPEIADEVTASTFERALRGMPAFRWQGGGFSSWLFRIAANELTSVYRNQQRASARLALLRSLPDVTSPSADTAVLHADRVAGILHALGTLPPRYQEVISLRYLAGLSHSEAAETMGLSKPALATLLYRAVGSLKKAASAEGMNE
jgi:RNA polymerase sigma-70 factor (ECF subfamily)